jgi:acetyl-CoA carboxylase biotin carboxyl carrier protein
MKTNKKGKKSADINDLFTQENIKAFIRYIESADIAEIEISVQDKSLYISKHRAAGPAPQPAAVSGQPAVAAPPAAPAAPEKTEPSARKPSNLLEITSPIVGTYYTASSPDTPPFVRVGDRVSAGQVVCIIEAMKIFNEIKSDLAGTVREICVQNEQPVEFGQVLFRLEP